MNETQQTIAFLGLGAMGQRMVKHLVTAGHHVTVWNRTTMRASQIEGAHVAASPRDAVRGAGLVISMVRDDEASMEVLCHSEHGALNEMLAGSHLVESSTLTIPHVEALGARCAERGVYFFDAPVAGTLPQAEAAALIYFVGGDEHAYYDVVSPVLSLMGSSHHYCGGVGRGAAMKLVVNALFASQVAVMAELLSVFESVGFASHDALDILGATPVCSPAAAGISRAMAARMYAPLFPIDLVEKDLRYVLDALGRAGMAHDSMMLAQAHRVFAHASELGFGGDHITGVRQVFDPA